MFGLSFQEVFVVGIIAILLFGKRLPEVAKTWGKSYRDFRKGLAEIQASFQVNDSSYRSSYSSSSKSETSSSYSEYDDYDEPTAPKFEPPPSEPHETVAPLSGETSPPTTPAIESHNLD